MTVYVLCPIDLDPTLDPNDPDEQYAEVVISIPPIWIGSLFNYELVPQYDTTNLLEKLYINVLL